MPDHMDLIQERCLREQEELAARQTLPASAGLDYCTGCSEAISPTRKALGARLCIDCQRIVEGMGRRR